MSARTFEKVDSLKKELQQHRPLTPSQLNLLKEYYRIGLTYSSNALEGNTLTETETKIVLEDGITIGGKSVKDHCEAVGHSHAYDFMYTLISKPTVSQENIKQLHQLFFSAIDPENAGHYRKEAIIITG